MKAHHTKQDTKKAQRYTVTTILSYALFAPLRIYIGAKYAFKGTYLNTMTSYLKGQVWHTLKSLGLHHFYNQEHAVL